MSSPRDRVLPSKAVTMNDIARAAHVSRPTVSTILNGRYSEGSVAAETQERVLKIARDLGYRRNALAQAVKTGRSYTLGFLAVEPDYEYSVLAFMGALDEAQDQGYTIKRFRLYDQPEDAKTIESCLEQRLDGIIVNDSGKKLSLDLIYREFAERNVPIVWYPEKPTEQGIQIRPDDEEGMVMAVRHLVELGHQRIAFLGGTPKVGTAIPRLAGFQRGVQEADSETSYVRWTHWDDALVTSTLTELLAQRVVPTAIICGSDPTALKVMLELHLRGIRIPDEISIVGCGNLARVKYAYPPLTTVAIPYKEMGKAAVVKLLSLIEHPDTASTGEEVVFPTPLIIRNSTESPPAITNETRKNI